MLDQARLGAWPVYQVYWAKREKLQMGKVI